MSLKKCNNCNHLCCNYITVKIPAPRTILDYDGLIWQLYHENIKALRDHEGWHLVIYNECINLKDNGQCAIYENRPITCRDHSIETCEYDGSIMESAINRFESPQELDEFCNKKFKTWKKRF